MSKWRTGWVVVVLSFACVSEDAAQPPPTRVSSTAAVVTATVATAADGLQPLPLDDIDDVADLRDPFEADAPAPLPPAEREGVAFGDTPVRGLKVSGTVDGIGDGKAIIADAEGQTQVLSVGARIGQLEKTPDGVLAEWHIDSVRDGRVYLLREGGALPATAILGEPVQANGRKRSASKTSDRPGRR